MLSMLTILKIWILEADWCMLCRSLLILKKKIKTADSVSFSLSLSLNQENTKKEKSNNPSKGLAYSAPCLYCSTESHALTECGNIVENVSKRDMHF